jgi:pyruvate dehydrogenase E2 component (dihydrolipoamide acetyltransferase)
MPLEIVMPKLGLTMTEGRIVEWMKREGDPVKKGEILFVLETEKVTFEVEAPEDGTLGKIVHPANDTVPIGSVVALLLRPGESPSDLKAVKGVSKTEEKAAVAPAPIQESATQSAPAVGRIKSSPLAKKVARACGMDLGAVQGSGPGGRIVRADVEAAHKRRQERPATPPPARVEGPPQKIAPLTGMRRAIAKKMLAAKVETAQTYMTVTVDAGKVQEHRAELLAYVEKKAGVRITVTDLLMKITGAAIQEHPVINTRWTPEGILYSGDVHMGMAMALDEGLIVPVIRDINRKGIAQVARDRVDLIKKGKDRTFLPDDISGSTFTLSSLGMFGIEQFTANINLPENAILAVGAIIDKPVALNGQVAIRPMMSMTLSYDHRTIDGADAARFMQTLKTFTENPILIFA